MNSTLLPHAVRAVVKQRGYALLSMITLGLGIGANISMFSLADALLLRPLLLPDLDRLVVIGGVRDDRSQLEWVAHGDYFDWKPQTRTMSHFSAYSTTDLNIASQGAEPERIIGAEVTSGFFETLGVKPLLGRTLLPGEDESGSHRVMVISQGLWESRFGGDPNVLSRTMLVYGRPHQIVGVVSADTRVPPAAQAWIPFEFTPANHADHRSFNDVQNCIARLKPGIGLTVADAEMRDLAERLAREHPGTHGKRSAAAHLLRERISGPETASYTRLMLWAALFLLLLACSNVANLHLARVSARARELAIRTALGAGRARIVGSLIAEGLVLGALGGVAGLFIGAWAIELIRGSMPAEVEVYLPGWKRIAINGRVLMYSTLLVTVCGVLAGLAPVFSGFLGGPQDVLKESGRGITAGRARHRIRVALVAAQTMLAMMLLVGAGLTVRGFGKIANPMIAGEPAKILTMRAHLPVSRYPETAQVRTLLDSLLRRVQAVPGVESAALSTALPYGGFSSSYPMSVEGRADDGDGFSRLARVNTVTADFFRTAGVTIHKGRALTPQDGQDSQPVAVVTEQFVRRFFTPGEDPIGRRVRLGSSAAAANNTNPWLTIVGIAADYRNNAGERTTRPMLYRPAAQAPSRSVAILVKTAGDPMALAASLRAQVHAVDSTQPVFDVKTLAKVISDDLVGFRYVAGVMGVFGLVALALAAVGLYSVISFLAAERTHEIGIRMALGARREDVIRQVLGQGMRLAGAGLVLGFVAALWLARMLSGLLFGVGGADPVSLAAVVAVLVVASLAACFIPARRAAGVDPLTALRHD